MRRSGLLLCVAGLMLCGLVSPVAAEEEDELIVMSHLGGHLAVNLESVETVFFMEKDGKSRFHLVWRGNSEGKTIEGPEASEVWAKIQSDMKHEFFWVTHMDGSLGISREIVTSMFFMPSKGGKPATLRVNYGVDAKTIEGAEAEALWKMLSK